MSSRPRLSFLILTLAIVTRVDATRQYNTAIQRYPAWSSDEIGEKAVILAVPERDRKNLEQFLAKDWVLDGTNRLPRDYKRALNRPTTGSKDKESTINGIQSTSERRHSDTFILVYLDETRYAYRDSVGRTCCRGSMLVRIGVVAHLLHNLMRATGRAKIRTIKVAARHGTNRVVV